jgi:hypothetical protein
VNPEHKPIFAVALVFIVGLAALTVSVVVREGPDVLTFVSLLVLGMLGFGILGALREPPG